MAKRYPIWNVKSITHMMTNFLMTFESYSEHKLCFDLWDLLPSPVQTLDIPEI